LISSGDVPIANVNKKCIIFWDMMPCSPLSFNRRFGGHIASIFRVEEIGSANQQARRWHILPKGPLKLNGLHGIISQKMTLFITTAVKTSNPTRNVLS
jgi:hypothetical protein